MANHAIIFSEETFPAHYVKEFEKEGCLPMYVGQDEKIYIINVWDIRLFFLLNYPVPNDVKLRYYEDYHHGENDNNSQQISADLVSAWYGDFVKGYQTGHEESFYENVLTASIWPLSKSDSNIKKHTKKLIEDYSERIQFITFGFDRENYFKDLGQAHGLYTRLNQIAERHWGKVKKKKQDVPAAVIARLKAELLKYKVINEHSENSSSGPMIRLVIRKLASQYGLSQTEVLKQITTPLGLRSNQLKDYSESKNKDINLENDSLVNSIFISISSKK